MEVSTVTTERLGNDNLQFQKTNHVLSSPWRLTTNNTTVESKVSSNINNNNNSNHNHHNDDQLLMADIASTLESLLVQVESEVYPVVTATTSQASIYDSCTKVSLITPVKDEDDDVNKTKDIVMLRNLEITPPPQDLISKATPSPIPTKDIENNTAKKRRSVKRTQSEQSDESSVSGRSKRQRRQTELFQFQAQSVQKSNSTRKQTKQTTKPETPQIKQEEQKFQDVIFYEKGDHLAIRNEENTFYLCQLTENVRVQKPFVKVRWLDTEDDGETYFLTSHYDKVPQKSIIMPVTLAKLKSDKKSKQFFTIDDQIKNSVLDRLKRSINTPAE
jgi:hypothetical protein